MSNNLVVSNHSYGSPIEFDDKQCRLLIDTICKGATPEEFNLFKMICKHTGLDPFLKQIYPVKRWNSKLGREEMTCQTSIDGYRLVAEKTGRYCPGREATYSYDKEGRLISATAYVKKQTMDGTWHEISATAFYSEYVQTNKDGSPAQFWKKMPHVMLSKCAEALALRKGWPAQLGTLYTAEEMGQAENPQRQSPGYSANLVYKPSDEQPIEARVEDHGKEKAIKKPAKPKVAPVNEIPIEYAPVEAVSGSFELEEENKGYFITPKQVAYILELIKGDSGRLTLLLAHYGIGSISDLSPDKYDEVVEILNQKRVGE